MTNNVFHKVIADTVRTLVKTEVKTEVGGVLPAIIRSVLLEELPGVLRSILLEGLGSTSDSPEDPAEPDPVDPVDPEPVTRMSRPRKATTFGVQVGQVWESRATSRNPGRKIRIVELDRDKVKPEIVTQAANRHRSNAKRITYRVLVNTYKQL